MSNASMIIAYNIFDDKDLVRFNFYRDAQEATIRKAFSGRVLTLEPHEQIIGDVRCYSFSTEHLQSLMDALWDAGIKPTELNKVAP